MNKKNTRLESSPIVSIIMPSWNGEKYIKESIESILNQSFTDFELILVNDFSDDNTAEIIKSFARNDKRIKVVENNKRKRLAQSINEGLEIAKGKYIARMDDDDIAMPDRISEEVSFLNKNPDVFLVGTAVRKIDENGFKKDLYIPPQGCEAIYNALEKGNVMVHPSIMFRRYPKMYFREKFWAVQDYDFFLRIKDNGLVMENLSKPLLKYRVSSKHSDLARMLKHGSFNYQAKLFHRERVAKGEDSYDTFNPKGFEDLTLDKVKSPEIIEELVFSSFKNGKYEECREYGRFYIKRYGLKLGILKYILISIIPSRIVKLLINAKRKFLQ